MAKQLSGGMRAKLAGKQPVQIQLAPADKALLQLAADTERRPLTQFVRHHAIEAAKRVLTEKQQ